MLYAYEIGKFQKDRADRLFGQGVILALASGIALFLPAFLGKNCYFFFMNPSETVMTYARAYYRYYQFLMLLYPMYALLIDIVYADGDELICNLSYAAQVGVNRNLEFGAGMVYTINEKGGDTPWNRKRWRHRPLKRLALTPAMMRA